MADRTTRRVRDEVVPIYAQHDQLVEIHWRLRNGALFIERRTCPPAMVIEGKARTGQDRAEDKANTRALDPV